MGQCHQILSVEAGVAVADFIQQTFDTLATVLAAINAGTITTTAKIDAANWPSGDPV